MLAELRERDATGEMAAIYAEKYLEGDPQHIGEAEIHA